VPHSHLDLSPEVHDAIETGGAVVALESTIISHGMPYPTNLETAVSVEAVVRDNGAVPATIAVLEGRLKVGLGTSDLERLATGQNVKKASSRDLAPIMIGRASAGTTVSATMRIADLAGISIFATGGTGGVHRGVESTYDVSADLIELAHTRTAVFCAGVKSILDIAKTLEYLETHRVPVVTYGTSDFPAFFTRKSGFQVDHSADSPEEIAGIIAMHRLLDSKTGLLVAVPIPEADSLDSRYVADLIDSAVAEADRIGISKKELTPFLLEQVNERSGGKSLQANIALIKNNAQLAARAAVALAEIHGLSTRSLTSTAEE